MYQICVLILWQLILFTSWLPDFFTIPGTVVTLPYYLTDTSDLTLNNLVTGVEADLKVHGNDILYETTLYSPLRSGWGSPVFFLDYCHLKIHLLVGYCHLEPFCRSDAPADRNSGLACFLLTESSCSCWKAGPHAAFKVGLGEKIEFFSCFFFSCI